VKEGDPLFILVEGGLEHLMSCCRWLDVAPSHWLGQTVDLQLRVDQLLEVSAPPSLQVVRRRTADQVDYDVTCSVSQDFGLQVASLC